MVSLVQDPRQDHCQDLSALCTKIAHRNSLAISTVDSGIDREFRKWESVNVVPFHRREDRRSSAIFDRKEIAHLLGVQTPSLFA